MKNCFSEVAALRSATELTGRNAELNNLETTEGFPTKFQKIIKGGDY
jgi:hypothetical protein